MSRHEEEARWPASHLLDDAEAVKLEDGPSLYKTFRDKQHGRINVVLKPN